MKSSQRWRTGAAPSELLTDRRRPPWSIGEVAAEFGLPTHVLRHWEHVGLLNPERDAADRRRYGHTELSRVAVIVRGKEAGIGLEQLKSILDTDPATRRDLLQAHHADLERRVAAIRDSQRLTTHALDCQHGDFTTCPRFHDLVDETIRQRQARRRAPDPDG